MVLLLHGVLLPYGMFEGLFYTFSMSQEAEAYREVFSLLMNAPAQLIKCGCSVLNSYHFGQDLSPTSNRPQNGSCATSLTLVANALVEITSPGLASHILFSA